MSELIRSVAEHPLAALGVGMWCVLFASAVVDAVARGLSTVMEKTIVCVFASRMTNTQMAAAAAMQITRNGPDAPRG